MDKAFLIQFSSSLAAVGVLVSLSAWARIGRPARTLDEARARELFFEDFPDRRIDRLWITRDSKGALARSGECALVLMALGDGFAVRRLSWCQASSAMFKGGVLSIHLGDVAAPRALLAFDNWPPADLAA